ncbi:type II toxin-antitoxin system HicB family antitoxin [Halocatena marina]|uniref:type II toxin-antitoxin system HicB family antitoxin n=1 Tax=Halocatena marina TaxID=2934937 RepID=UPI0020107B91|nr:hypothetical protein [Halocatena marina]
MRHITLTENPDGRWTAYDTATETVTDGNTRDDALKKLDAALDEQTEPDTPPAAPLKELVGLVDDEGAERVKQRSQEFREEVNERTDRRRNDRRK